MLTANDLQALKAINTNSVPNETAILVLTPPSLYQFDRFSIVTSLDTRVVQPTTGPGRWYLQVTPIPSFERLDPLNGTPGLNQPGDVLSARVPTSIFNQPVFMVNDGTYNWITNASEPYVVRHKVSDNSYVLISVDQWQPTSTTVKRNGTWDIDQDATHVFVTTESDDGATSKNILIISKATLSVVGVCQLPGPAFFGVSVVVGTGGDSDKVFVSALDASPTSIYRFSRAAALAAYPTPVAPDLSLAHPTAGYFNGLHFNGGFLYAGSDGLYKITPALVVSASYTPGGGFSLVDVLFAFGSVWGTGTDGGANQLFRFNPAAIGGGPTASLALPNNSGAFPPLSAYTLAADGTTIWTTNIEDRTVNRVSTGVGTEAVIATVTSPAVNDLLTGIAYDGTNIQVVVQLSPFGPGVGVNAVGGLTDPDSYGTRKISTGLGTEAFFGSLFIGTAPPLVEWKPRHATGKFLVGPIVYTVRNDESLFICDTSLGTVQIMIPDTPFYGREIEVKDYSPGNASVNNITVTSTDLPIEQFAGADAASLVLATDRIAVTLKASYYPNVNASPGNWSIV